MIGSTRCQSSWLGSSPFRLLEPRLLFLVSSFPSLALYEAKGRWHGAEMAEGEVEDVRQRFEGLMESKEAALEATPPKPPVLAYLQAKRIVHPLRHVTTETREGDGAGLGRTR